MEHIGQHYTPLLSTEAHWHLGDIQDVFVCMVALDEFHSLSEAGSWALHRQVAAILKEQPQLLEGVRARVDQWLMNSACHLYANDWKQLIDGSFEHLVETLISKSERMCTLRQAGHLDAHQHYTENETPQGMIFQEYLPASVVSPNTAKAAASPAIQVAAPVHPPPNSSAKK